MAKDTTSTTKRTAASDGGSRPLSRLRGSGTASAGRTRATAAGTSGGAARARPGGALEANAVVTFFRESRAELRKVTWPTPQETLNLTIAVIVMTVSLAVFLGLCDSALDAIIRPLIGAK